MTAEPFLLRLNDGPDPGTYVIRDGTPWSWPLPDEIPAALGGRYRKIRESQLEPQPEGSHVLRGAEYNWESR